MNPLWRKLACGHSFHIHCNLPCISECSICKNHLLEGIDKLAAKANSVVLSGDGEESADDEECDLESYESDNENDDVEEDVECTEQALSAMVDEICLWRHDPPPTS